MLSLLLTIAFTISSLTSAETNTPEFLDRFLVLNEAGNSAAPGPLGSKINTVGVLFLPLFPDRFGVCTVTHVSPGKVLTAAHCLSESGTPANYSILFFDKRGNRQTARVEGFLFSGTKDLDIALLKISDEAASVWDTAGLKVQEPKTKGWFDYTEPSEKVKIWSFTPLSSHPFRDRFPRRDGMVFAPNLCRTSVKAPRIEMKEVNPETMEKKTLKEFVFGKDKESIKTITFLDECESPFVQGNSGALITIADDFSAKIAVVSFYTADMDNIGRSLATTMQSQKNIEFYYRGTSDLPKRIRSSFGSYILGLGSLIDTSKFDLK
jgi:hypothetical protein